MRQYKIVPWILLILSIINVSLTAPVVLRAIRHACVDVMDVREDVIPVAVSGLKKENDELEKPWDKPSPAMHPRTSPAPSESDYESAPGSPSSFHSFHTATSEFEQESPEIETPPGEESSIQSESHRIYDDMSSENYQASNEGGPGSSKSYSFSSLNLPAELGPEREPVAGSNPSANGLPTTSSPAADPGSQKSFLSKLASKSKSFLSKLASKSKNFFSKLAGKLKFWRPVSA